MNTEPKPHLIAITPLQAAPLIARQADVNVPHVYTFRNGTYWVRADEWRAFEAISGGEQT